MAIDCYLAMTEPEIRAASALPKHFAFMACHFRCYGTGLTNLPQSLPPDAIVIIDDCVPMEKHDPGYILEQLLQLCDSLHPKGFLLDFQRTGSKSVQLLVNHLVERLPCPTAVSESYAKDLSCPVFLSCPAPNISLEQHISPWKQRQIWLEIALEAKRITVTAEGSTIDTADSLNLFEPIFQDTRLQCSYHIDLTDSRAVFHIARRHEDVSALLSQAENLGVTQAVALYQQLGT